ncbi:PAS domain S-box protein [Zobellia alginiliquefaciens]|uniref:PAS domain S-box protein n=1 Tax=Zobellia alginiliquefaciens TaxID=3032586 RepID=UPI0023E4124C|nr:PAS domain S-box protein [Zobellia alginiliquefaciens]
MPDFDLLPSGVICLNLKETIVNVNPYILKKLGYKLEELKNNSINSLLSPGSRILYKTHFYPILVGKNIVHEIVLSLAGKDGTKHPFLFNMSMDASGILITGLFLNKRSDFESGLIEAKNAAETALLKNKELMLAQKELGKVQKELENQLQEERTTNKELRILNKMISHDLQEPLRKIQLFASKTLSKPTGEISGEVIQRNLNRIIDIANEGHSLTKRLQLFSELEYYPLRKAHLDLVGVIELTKKHSTLSQYGFNYDLEINSLYGDENKVNVLFTELFNLIGRLIGPYGVKSVNIASVASTVEAIEDVPSSANRKELIIRLMADPEVQNGDALRMMDRGGGHRLLGVSLDNAFCEKITSLHGGSFNLEILGPGKISIEIVLPYVSL